MKDKIISLLEDLDILMDCVLGNKQNFDPYYVECIKFTSKDIKKMIRFIGRAKEHCDDETAVTLDDIESEIAMYNSIIYNANTPEDRRNIAREYLSIAEFHKSLKQSIGVNKQYSEWVKDNELS